MIDEVKKDTSKDVNKAYEILNMYDKLYAEFNTRASQLGKKFTELLKNKKVFIQRTKYAGNIGSTIYVRDVSITRHYHKPALCINGSKILASGRISTRYNYWIHVDWDDFSDENITIIK